MPLFNLAPDNPSADEVIKTPIIKSEINSDGALEKTLIFEEDERSPLESLSFEDEKITNLLKNGITPKHLNIQEDERVGGDADLREVLDIMNEEINPYNN